MPVIEASAWRPLWAMAVIASVVGLVACSSTARRAPVEERSATPRATVAAASPAVAASAPEVVVKPPVVDSAPRLGYYTVKPGDTLIRISLDSGQNWKDLVRWNNLDNPNVIEVGQTLRVVAPGVDPAAATSRPVTTTRVEPRPLDARPAASGATAAAASTASTPSAASSAQAAALSAPSTASAAATPKDADDDIAWGWPVPGAVTVPFDDAHNKGLVFRGKAGDPVLAAADGRVVYAGSGLRGYGNLVILKHNATYLTAYAHNQTLLVKDDQTVRKGQKIAEMGATDADSVQLHFEIRKQGKPVDPAKLLPPR